MDEIIFVDGQCNTFTISGALVYLTIIILYNNNIILYYIIIPDYNNTIY